MRNVKNGLKAFGVAGAALCLIACAGSSKQGETAKQPEPPTPKTPFAVTMETSEGPIELELDPVHAPIGVANFLSYARHGDYNGTVFHRIVPGFVIQGGGYDQQLVELKGHAAIKNEWQNGLKNTRGTIAWARDADPDTATREFYINVADNAKLDGPRAATGNAGYAVFGHVTKGMDTVDRIVRQPRHNQLDHDMKDVPDEPVVVTNVVVHEPK